MSHLSSFLAVTCAIDTIIILKVSSAKYKKCILNIVFLNKQNLLIIKSNALNKKSYITQCFLCGWLSRNKKFTFEGDF